MWIVAFYEATALFSLKPATATSSGGRTLLIPTPFAIKMALLDVIIRTRGVAVGEDAWPILATTTVAIRPARRLVVNNTFTKIVKPRRKPAEPGTAHAGPLQKTIGYREYVYMDGPFGLALQIDDYVSIDNWQQWLAGIQSLGKRGSFVQLLGIPEPSEMLPQGFVLLDGTLPETYSITSLMQEVDDSAPTLTFGRVNVYSEEKIELGKHRLLRTALLPYRRVKSSRAYTLYQATD